MGLSDLDLWPSDFLPFDRVMADEERRSQRRPMIILDLWDQIAYERILAIMTRYRSILDWASRRCWPDWLSPAAAETQQGSVDIDLV